jgi:predicted TIM-barrel fold metal-dependent hydrolase
VPRNAKEKPSTYFKRSCWVSSEAGEELAPVFVEHVGDDYLMIATDYPHSDAIDKFPDKTVGAISSNEKISRASRTKILWDNPTKAFGLGA